MQPERVAIVGAGIGGLTLALCLHRAGIACRVYEPGRRSGRSASASTCCRTRPPSWQRSASLPSSSGWRRHARGGVLQPLRPARLRRAPRGAGPATRRRSSRSTAATCRRVLLAAVRDRIGVERWSPATLASASTPMAPMRSACAFAIRAARRCPRSWRRWRSAATASTRRFARQRYPDEGPPRWSGVNMWRGVTRMRALPERRDDGPGRLASVGKMVIYPIRNDIDVAGPAARQLGRRARGEGAGGRDWSAAAGWATSSLRSPTGTSTGSMSPR